MIVRVPYGARREKALALAQEWANNSGHIIYGWGWNVVPTAYFLCDNAESPEPGVLFDSICDFKCLPEVR